MVSLATLVRPQLVFRELAPASWEAALGELAGGVAAAGWVADGADLHRRLLARERQGPTTVGGGVALPHCKVENLARPLVAVGLLSPPGISAGAPDGEPVRALFLVISPEQAPAVHLQVLAAISRWLKAPGRIAQLLAASSAAEVMRVMEEGP
ncbi:MAG TPA: PTS sugar transporter subunit IIA [Thermoanaerobaculia bacterium]|nr:PTS sugar transporter subunit IIA [Thermoanaerobaculia bacterium]